MKELYASIPGISNIESVDVSSSHVAQLTTATITCLDISLDIGSEIEVSMGYTDDYGVAFTGYVKMIDETESPHQFVVSASDVLARASDYFIVSSTPTTPLTVQNKSPESIIQQLLALAGITDYSYDSSSYVWGVSGPIEINLVSVYDYCKMLADMIAWGFWADSDGTVYFKDRRPYPMGGDSSVGTVTTGDLITLSDSKSDKNLRNKIVVWGSKDIYATASASSPYLPEGFYKTSVISAPGIIDSQSMAQSVADFHLAIFNRLTRGYAATTIGNYRYLARKVLHLNYTDEDLYIYMSDLSWSKAGFICNLELRKE